MLDRAFKPLLNTKVVNDENENNWAPSMAPRPGVVASSYYPALLRRLRRRSFDNFPDCGKQYHP